MTWKVCAITGASGYVGSRIAAALSSDFDVVPLSRAAGSNGILWTFGSTAPIVAQLRDRQARVLVHTAWDFSQSRAKANWKVNVDGSERLLNAAISAGLHRFVFVSTISAFEDARSEYGKSKFAVERLFLAAGGTVIRPGLVWGERPGGMFGSLRQQTSRGGFVPLIGNGNWLQYLVHEDDLAAAVLKVASEDACRGKLLTIANPKPWTLRRLMCRMAEDQNKDIRLVPISWHLLNAVLKVGEALGVKLPFRSDSLVSLVYQNPKPHFDQIVPTRAYI